jgi:hypothetical protein
MLRTDENTVVMQAMQTIREVGSDFKNVVMEVHGMFDQFAGSLFRIPGKLMSSNTSSPVWTLTQLRFRDTIALIQQNGSTISVSSTFPDLPGLVFPEIVWPPMLHDDYPQSNPPPYLPWSMPWVSTTKYLIPSSFKMLSSPG